MECLSKIASEAPDVQLTSEAAEQLKGSRAIFSRKAAFFYESMTLFPLGQHIMQVTNLALESHFRDIGFGKELEACVQMCIDLKNLHSGDGDQGRQHGDCRSQQWQGG